MSNINVTSNITIKAYEQSLLAGWKAYIEFPVATTKTIPVAVNSIGLLANTTLLIYLINSRRCHLLIFAMLTSLAMCDWLSSFSISFMVMFILPEVVFALGARSTCRAFVYISAIAYNTSICYLVALAALRFYQLVYPLQAKVRVTIGHVVKCSIGIWILCAALHTPYPINYTIALVPYNDKTLRYSRAVMLLITCFALGMLPKCVHVCYHSVLGYPYLTIHMSVILYTGMLQSLNSVVDPFLYLLSFKEIRQDIYKMVRNKARKKT